ncbi:MAG: hypothetical protein A3J49_10870 [Gallionellales bacterium RIFCSPHIGHO2_02_FULL_57_16]|nr:MAG: hypothetical protein A3J49_10870 [Gallionellales bacterium RIFCSPHIGHO2_02_FULL_57_16]
MVNPVQSKIALLLPNLDGGGAGIFVIGLANQLAMDGFSVDLVLVGYDNASVRMLDGRIRIINLNSRGALLALIPLVRYLKQARPTALIATSVHVNVVAIIASLTLRNSVRVYVRETTTPSKDDQFKKKHIKAKILSVLRRWLYPLANKVIAPSHGVADDLSNYLNIPRKNIAVIPNGLNFDLILEKAIGSIDHPFFLNQTDPVIIGVGRLSAEKDFKTLIHAFRQVLLQRPARLVILGEGALRDELEDLIRVLGVEGRVALPGVVDNPYKYMHRASVFVLSSLYEGFPNVLLEALAVGTHVVATDCQSGPREILAGGRYGALVSVGDVEAMSSAIIAALDDKSEKPALNALREHYGIGHVASNYAKALGMAEPVPSHN